MTKIIDLPREEPSPNVRLLSQLYRETITGQTTASVTLGEWLIDGSETIHKNGVLLTPATDYTLSGTTMTLTVAAVAGDVFVVRGLFRQQ